MAPQMEDILVGIYQKMVKKNECVKHDYFNKFSVGDCDRVAHYLLAEEVKLE